MNKELEALKVLYTIALNANYLYQKEGKETDDYKERMWLHKNIIETALKNYEWILSKLDLDFLDRLNTEDKIKLAKILGAKIDYE